MGCILIGLLVSFVILRCTSIAKGLELITDSDIIGMLYFLCFTVLFVSIFIGIFADVSGYEEPIVIETTNLVGIQDSRADSGVGFVHVSTYCGEKVYSYNKELETEEDSAKTVYESDYVWGGNITIVEDDAYKDSPKLVAYVKKARKTFWALGMGYPNVSYVFYVPVESVFINQ